jgi:hypothetical protein
MVGEAIAIAVEALAPVLGEVIKAAADALDSGKTREEALQAAKAAFARVHVVEDSGTWDEDLKKREERG